MVVALNGAQDFLAEDLLDITKENEIENAAVSEAAALSSNVIAKKLTEHAAYSTSLFPRITQEVSLVESLKLGSFTSLSGYTWLPPSRVARIYELGGGKSEVR